MENKGNDTLPPFPPTPVGVDRLKHMPTVEACIHYWDAVSSHAWEIGDDTLLEIASGLKESYEEARAELSKADRGPKSGKRLASRPRRRSTIGLANVQEKVNSAERNVASCRRFSR